MTKQRFKTVFNGVCCLNGPSISNLHIGVIRMRKLTVLTALTAMAAFGLATSAYAAPFLDDFSSDTSDNYAADNSFNSGGSWEISGGTANITTGTNNTFSIFHNTAQLEIGETLSADLNRSANGGDMRLSISTATTGPNQPGNGGLRLKYKGSTSMDVQAYGGGTTTSTATGITSPATTLFITRDDADTFTVGYNGNTVLGTYDVTGLTSAGLYIGFENFGNNLTNSFDNLQIVPEPGSLALLGMGGLLMLRRNSAHAARRRRG